MAQRSIVLGHAGKVGRIY
jgi:hypothetical protein